MTGDFSAACARAALLAAALAASVSLHAATAVDDFYTMVNDGSPYEMSPLSNDEVTPQGGIETAELVQGSGVVSFEPQLGTVTFQPAPGFYGTVLIDYMAYDEVEPLNDIGRITLEVTAPPPPMQAVDDAVSAPHNTGSMDTPIFIDVLGNDILAAEITPTVYLLGGLTPAGAGTLVPNTAGTGFDFTPAVGFSGEASFSYQLVQGEDMDSATVTITVGDAPAPDDLVDNALLNPTERRVAQALDNACANATSALAASCQVITGLSAEQQRSAIQQILPTQAPAQALGALLQQNQQLTNLHSRLQALRGGAQGISFSGLSAQLYDQSLSLGSMLERGLAGGSAGEESPFADTPWGLFVTGRLNFGDVSSQRSRADFDFKTLGITAGIDYRFDDQLVLGGALGFGTTDNDYDSSRGSLDIDSWTLSFYGNYYPLDNLYVDWVLGYGRNDYSGDRRLRFGPIDAIADYDADGNQYSGSATVGYQWSRQAWQYGTYLRLDYIHTQIDAYRESGGAGLALAMNEQNARSLESALGGRLARAFSFSRGVLIPGVELEWIHQWQGDARLVTAALVEAPASGNFSVIAEGLDENYLKAGLSLTGVFTGGKSGFLRYQTSMGRDDIDEHTIEAGFRMEF